MAIYQKRSRLELAFLHRQASGSLFILIVPLFLLLLPEAARCSAPTSQIQLQTSPALCFDVLGGSVQAGQPLDAFSCYLGDPHETFAFQSQPDGTFTVVPQNGASPPLCLDVLQTRVVQEPCNGSRGQRWVLLNNHDGTFSLENFAIAGIISVPVGTQASGTPLVLTSPGSSDSITKFQLTGNIQTMVSIHPRANPDFCVDIFGGSTNVNYGVDVFECILNDPHETFALNRLANGAFILSPQNNSVPPLCLDTKGISQAGGVQAVQNPCSGAATQQFTVVNNLDGTQSLVSLDRHWALAMAGSGTAANRTPILASSNEGSPQAEFVISGFSPQKLQVVSTQKSSQGYNMCLDIYGGSTVSGVSADIWACALGDPHETFAFRLLNDGRYNLIPQNGANPSLCLDAKGLQIVQNPCSGSVSQQWNVAPNGDGSYSFLTADGSQSMQLPSGTPAFGNPMILGSSQFGAIAKFTLPGFNPVAFNGGDGQYQIGASGYTTDPIFPLLASILPVNNTGPSGETMAIVIEGGSTQAGFGVATWAYNAGDYHESFAFNLNSNGTYTIYADNGAYLCLDAAPGANQQVVQNPCSGASTQQFLVNKNSDQTYSILTPDSKLALEVQAAVGKIPYGTKIIAMQNKGDPQAKFNMPGFTLGMKNPIAVNPAPHGRTVHLWLGSASSSIFPGVTRSGSYNRDIWVYIPSQYVSGTEVPFMVVQDAAYMGLLPSALDGLIQRKKLPTMIAIFAASGLDQAGNPHGGFGIGGGNEGTERNWEYDTMNDAYARWVDQELLPFVTAQVYAQQGIQLNLTADPNGRGAIGGSSGGTAAFNMAWFRNSSFSRVIAYSGSFTALECLMPLGGTVSNPLCPPDPVYPHGAASFYANNVVQNSTMRNLRVWMSAGSDDMDWSSYGSYLKWSVAEPAIASALDQKGYHYHLDMALGTTHVDVRVPQQTLPTALQWVWRGYPIQ